MSTISSTRIVATAQQPASRHACRVRLKLDVSCAYPRESVNGGGDVSRPDVSLIHLTGPWHEHLS